jgi:nitroreductase
MNNTLKTIHSLRSVHGNFSSQEIKDEDLKLILDACVRAANASARQSYSIIVVTDRNLMKKLSGFTGSKALVFCVDYNRIIDAAEHLGQQFSEDGVIPFVTGSTDTILAAQTAAIAAKSLGIDSLFTNGIHRGNITRVYELLDLPEKYCFPLIMLVLGYPQEEPSYLKGRLSGPGVIHHGKYHRATTNELELLVQQYDDPEKHLGLDSTYNTWNQNNYEHYLDWFYSLWSPRLRTRTRGGKKEGKSQMHEILERIGFLERCKIKK